MVEPATGETMQGKARVPADMSALLTVLRSEMHGKVLPLGGGDARREAAASKMGFSAYGVTQKDDPLSQALRSLMQDNRAQEQQIAQLWAAIEKLGGAAEANKK